jgi:hypothetical protein
MAKWTDLPPDIGTILRRSRDLKLTQSINIFFLDDGRTMVSVQNPKNRSSYYIAHDEDPIAALIDGLGPGAGGSWEEHLQPGADKRPAPPPVEEDEDDDMDVV